MDCGKGDFAIGVKYHKKRTDCGNVYSIDFFTFEFSLNLTAAMWSELENVVKEYGQKAKRFKEYSGTKKKGKYHKYRAYEVDKLHIQFYDDAPVVQLDFNPNTVHTSDEKTALRLLQFLMNYMRTSAAVYDVRIRRVDYALDIPQRYTEIYVYTRKCESHIRSTRYYGDPKASGRLRVYDKAAEQEEKHGIDIGDLTRCEWIQRNERPFNYDTIGTFDFSHLTGGVSVIQLVPVEFFNEALQRFAQNTRKKIITGMKKIAVKREYFDELLQEYYAEYGIPELRRIGLENRVADMDFSFSMDDSEEDESVDG